MKTIFSVVLIVVLVNLNAQQLKPKWDFKGKYLIAISDADMLPSAYEDRRLGPLYGDDKLSVIPLGGDPVTYKAHSITVSNSVTGPPSVIDVSPDGRYAYVIETLKPRPGKSDDEVFADLAVGNKLMVIDLQDPRKPEVRKEIDMPNHPVAISVNYDGSMLAICYTPMGAGGVTPVSIHKVEKGIPTEAYYPEVPGWSLHNWMFDIVWHPTQNTFAIINTSQAQVSFMNVLENDTTVYLEQWGNTVSTGKGPMIGRFTSNGKHLLVNNLFWGPDVQNYYTEGPRSTIANITLNHFQQNGSPVHSLTSQVMVGASAEGFDVSPNGQYVAVANMERSWLPYDDERQTWFSSISLIERDSETGAMNLVSTTPYYAVLPEMVVFDASSKYLAVVAADQYDHNIDGGSVDFFQIVHDPLDKKRKMLVQTRTSIPVQHGAHDIILVE